MILAGIDIATEKMFLTIEKDGELLELRHALSTPEKYNSAVVIPELVESVKKHHLTPDDIDCLAINIGPGSFTGIRACAVMARTIGQFLNIPVVGIPSLEIYANAVESEKDKLVILDARRNKWYTGQYLSNNEVMVEPELKLNTNVLEIVNQNTLTIITEYYLKETLQNFSPVYIEEIETDFGLVLLKLARQKLEASINIEDDFAWYKLKPVYLQTPSISIPKKVKF